MNTPPPRKHYKYRRPLPDQPCPTPQSKRKASVETPPPSLKRAHIPDGKNPITPQRASLFLNDAASPMSTLTDATIMSSMKQRKQHQTPQRKGFSQVSAPSTYHLSSAADSKVSTPGKDPRLSSHPPALLPARQVDSSSEYKASSQATVSPDAKHKEPPKIPGPARAPAGGRGYEHQRKRPPPQQMSTMPLPFTESVSALRKGAERPSPMMRSNPGARSGPPQPQWRPGMATPPGKNSTTLTPNSALPSPASLGPKARGMPGRELFAAEINKMEQEKEKLPPYTHTHTHTHTSSPSPCSSPVVTAPPRPSPAFPRRTARRPPPRTSAAVTPPTTSTR